MSKIWDIDNVLIMLKLVGGFMEVVINDLEDLKRYMRVYKDKKEISLKFDEVVFNCALPNKNHFNYFQGDNILHYTINLKANKITFNYYAELDNVYAKQVVANDVLICKLLNVIGKTISGYIGADVFIGIDVEVNTMIVKKICCKNIKAAFLSIAKENGSNEDYHYLEASSVKNIGV